jgi:hypothetical protein
MEKRKRIRNETIWKRKFDNSRRPRLCMACAIDFWEWKMRRSKVMSQWTITRHEQRDERA